MTQNIKIINLKNVILNFIKHIDTFILKETEINNLLDMCYNLNYHLNNTFLDDILYDTKLKYQNNYDDFYIYENINKIKKFIISELNKK